MALIDDIIAATDKSSVAAVTAANSAITAINATRVNIAAANADAGSAAAVKAHISGEATTALPSLAVPPVDKAKTPVSGPAAVPSL
jgi:hypothetical protein